MKPNSAKETGALIATFLTGSWRPDPPPLDLSAEVVEKIAPLLSPTGAGALGWWRVRNTELENHLAVDQLHQAFRLYTIESRRNQSKIAEVFAVFRSHGVEPVLIKGWAAARYYPDKGLRPYGDIDICVRQKEFQTAERAVTALDPVQFRIDLHAGFTRFGVDEDEVLFKRSQLIKIDQTDVRILCPEDHLRVVCFHLMREGAWRPLWLVDVAAAVESQPPEFDWNYFLGDERQAAPLVNAIRLAQQLLEAKAESLPEKLRSQQYPRWLVPTVLKEWGSPAPSMIGRHDASMLMHVRRRKDLLAGLRHRWPNAIEATTTMRARFNNLPRLPFQISNSLFRLGAFLTHLPRTWKK
ncbi:MAG TPA: nucleotidyltransferase family protein [Pyrinomonadaceae bacterium]|nr:nucleotidyltransferase family protein [Pyrinomonadaceae bacterium]